MLRLFFDIDSSSVPVSTLNGMVMLPLIVVTLLIILIICIKKKYDFIKIIFLFVVALYAFTLIESLFFPIPYIPSEFAEVRDFSNPIINLVPFAEMLHAPIDIIIRNLIGNMIIFIPLGLFIPLLLKSNNNIRKSIFIIISTALFVELIQYIGSFLLFNLNWKVVDIDDFIMNCLGGFVGLACYHISGIIIQKYSTKNENRL